MRHHWPVRPNTLPSWRGTWRRPAPNSVACGWRGLRNALQNLIQQRDRIGVRCLSKADTRPNKHELEPAQVCGLPTAWCEAPTPARTLQTLSSCEAELYTINMATIEALNVKSTIEEIFEGCKTEITIQIDSSSAKSITSRRG